MSRVIVHAHRCVRLGLVVAGLVACSPAPESAQSPRVVKVTSFDYAFSAPDTIVAGATTFHLVNKGPSQHHLVIFALPEGMSLATFDRLMRADSVGGTGIEVVGGAEGPADGATDAWATLDLAPGKTLADAAAWEMKHEGTQPFVYVGGVTAMAPGRTSIARLDLGPGRYVIACVDDDGTAPKLHFQVGMVREFAVVPLDGGR